MALDGLPCRAGLRRPIDYCGSGRGFDRRWIKYLCGLRIVVQVVCSCMWIVFLKKHPRIIFILSINVLKR